MSHFINIKKYTWIIICISLQLLEILLKFFIGLKKTTLDYYIYPIIIIKIT